MEYTEDQKRGFLAGFAALRRRQLLATVPLVVIVLLVALAERGAGYAVGMPHAVWAPLAGLYVVGFIAFTLKNWRCPACRRYLGKGIGPTFCPRCGERLQE
jgi:hypothetical protein